MCPLDKESLAKNSRSRPDLYEFREKLQVLRVLPPSMEYFTEDINYIAWKILVHWNVGPEGTPPLTCPRSWDNTAECPICAIVRKYRNNPDFKELIHGTEKRSGIRASARYLFNIFDTEHPEKGVQKMETGPGIHDDLVKIAVDPEYGEVLDPRSGRNFKITFTPGAKSKNGYNNYDVLPSANESDISAGLPENWKDSVRGLKDSIPAVLMPEEMNKLLGVVIPADAPEKSAGTPPDNATTSPASESTPPKTEEKKEEPPKEEPKKEEAPSSGGNPTCFGKDYSSGSVKCKECPVRKECVTEFVM